MPTPKPKVPTKQKTMDFPVVGVGASAGGLEAFQRFVKAIPADSGMAYVLVQHLAPTPESLLPEILTNWTTIPVYPIFNDITLAPNNIYIIPENTALTAYDGKLKLTPRDLGDKKNMCIDLFFNSLAEVHQSFAIGIVLSGTGFDGARGLKSIKELGGITYAQTPESAAFDGMPRNAINSGSVDFQLPPDKIPEHLQHIRKAYLVNHAYDGQESVPTDDEYVYKQILSLLRLHTGNNFSNYKQSTIRRRIARRMVVTRCDTPAQYLSMVADSTEEQDALFNDILIPVTHFFRDEASFAALRTSILPHIISDKNKLDPIRIWSAGCSTGEEAYSLAILLHEFLAENAPQAQVRLFASDISENAIQKARSARYSAAETRSISESRLEKYFTKNDGHFHINKEIRDMCVFAVHNFVQDPPFAKMDLISCRNALIYLNPVLQKTALKTFHYALKNNGVLFLGKSESITKSPELFSQMIPGHKMFIKKHDANFFPTNDAALASGQVAKKDYHPRLKSAKPSDYKNLAFDVLLNQYTPSAVIINSEMEIVHFHGNTGKYLMVAQGKPDFNILKMIRSELAFELRNTLQQATSADSSNIKSKPQFLKDDDATVAFEIIPLQTESDQHYLILFDYQKTAPENEVGKLHPDEIASQRIAQLEAELEQLRSDIRNVQEDHEMSTQQLQSANYMLQSTAEELQSLNEELETSAEEIQSNNEELITINDELMDRQEQLVSMRMYAEAIVETIREPLLILDADLQVKSANSSFYKYFKTSETETEGRKISEIGVGHLGSNDLRTELLKIIPHKIRLQDFEITADFPHIGKRTVLLNARQIVNARHAEQLILLAFDDITELKISKLLRESEERFRALADTAPVLLWVAGVDKKGTFFNHGWLDFTGNNMEQQIGDGWLQSIHPADRDMVMQIFTEKFELRQEYHTEYRLRRHDGEYRWVSAKGVPRFSAEGIFLGYVGGCMDIHTQKNFFASLEEQVVQRTKDLRESQSFLQSVLDTSQNLIYIYDFELEKITFINSKAIKTTGFTAEQIASASVDIFTPLIHQDDLPQVIKQRKVLRESTTDDMTTVEFRLKNKLNGWTCQLSRDAVFKRDQHGKALQYLGVCTDVSEIKNANEQLISKNRELEHSNIELASFSSIASHDLKEPLRKIQVFSKLVIAKDKANVSDDSKNFLDRVIVSAYRMQQLIDDLISYSRTSSMSKINYVSTNMNKLIDDALVDLDEIIAKEKAVIEVEPLPVLAVLPSQFRQLFVNLISNAIKYRNINEAPHIIISAEMATEAELETLDSKPNVEYCRITVSDNGIGFLEEYDQKIFEPFQRLHDKDEYTGTGIGLAICKKIMLNHHGFIKAKSVPAKGSKFLIYIPINN